MTIITIKSNLYTNYLLVCRIQMPVEFMGRSHCEANDNMW